MNVTENLLLKQMQMLAGAVKSVPQTGTSKNSGDSVSFQDMIEKAGDKVENKADAGAETGEKKPVDEKEPQEVQGEKAPGKEEKEELKAENLTANPNPAGYMDLFRPEIAPVVEEAAAEPVLVEVPVEAAAEPETAVDLPAMEIAESAGPVEAPEEAQTGFQEALEEAPQQAEEAPVEEAAAPVQQEKAVEAKEVREELPEAEVKVVRPEDDTDEPKAEAAEADTPVFHDAKAATVKVGETYETVDTQEPDMDEKLANTIRQAVQNGAERVEIRLTPENLGSLTIEMTRDVNGAIQVVLHASNSRAAGLLNQHMDGLHAALQNYSQESVHIEVQRNEESQQQSLHQQANPDGRGQNRQQQERREEQHTDSGDFLQKMRLGLFGSDDTL